MGEGLRRDWLRRYGLLLAIALAAAALRGAILLTSQSHVDGDEGVVGVMARHVLYEGARPIFYYGQPYGGGAAVEAYLAALGFWLFGPSVVVFKGVAFALTFAALPLTASLCLRHFDRGVAMLAVALLATASAWIEWNTKVRGGYAAMLPLAAAIWWLWAEIAYRRGRPWMPAALGLLGGFAYYNQELLAPLLAVLAATTLIWQRGRWRRADVAWLVAGALLGASPLIAYNLTHDFENLRHMLGSTRPGSFWEHAAALPGAYWPRLFDPQNADAMRARVPLQAYVEAALYAALLAVACVDAIRSRRAPHAVGEACSGPRLQSVMLGFAIVHVLAYLNSRGAGISSRYLLPLYPTLPVLAALAIRRLWAAPSLAPRAAALLSGVLLVGIGVGNALSYVGPSRVRIAVWTHEAGFENVEIAGDAIPKIIDELRTAGVRHVRTSHFVQWPLAFESGEELVASSATHLPGGSVYPGYDRRVAAAEARGEPVAYVFHRRSLHWDKPGGFRERGGRRELVALARFLEARGLQRREIADFVVYAPPG